MQPLRLAALVLGLALILLAGCGSDPAKTALQVNDVAADPAAYSGTITVTGITKGFSRADATVFGIMDLKEMQCNSPNCSMPMLPVKFAGQLPVINAEVLATGQFVKGEGGYLFDARDVKVVRVHQIGG
jgi:hypothetical protein